MATIIYQENNADISILDNKQISVIGYGNQAKAQALNMRDMGLSVSIGVEDSIFKKRAEKDNFETLSISEAVKQGDIIFLLLANDDMKEIFEREVRSNLQRGKTIVFADGYYIHFNIIKSPSDVDILLISPRALGEVVRQQFINQEGFFTFIAIHQDISGNALNTLLALTKAIGGLKRAAVKLTFEQQTILNLFAEQAFRSAFNQVLMRAIKNLVNAGYPSEAVYIELILSEEMIYTVDKMINVGLIKQMNYHSQTSQYGSLSRGIKFAKVGSDIKEQHKNILEAIQTGKFAQDWAEHKNTGKLDIIKSYAYSTDFSESEKKIYHNLNYTIKEDQKEYKSPSTLESQLSENQALKTDLEKYKDFYRQL